MAICVVEAHHRSIAPLLRRVFTRRVCARVQQFASTATSSRNFTLWRHSDAFYGYKGASRYLLITELAECSLADKIQSDDDISPEECARFGSEIASGMAYIHSNSMIHFDLKPANVLLDASSKCKICDLGIAKLTGDAAMGTIGMTAGATARVRLRT